MLIREAEALFSHRKKSLRHWKGVLCRTAHIFLRKAFLDCFQHLKRTLTIKYGRENFDQNNSARSASPSQ